MLLNFRPDIIRVHIDYEDGTSDSFDVPKGAGFVREGYTYRQDNEHSERVTSVLHTFEVFWAHKKEEMNAAGQSA